MRAAPDSVPPDDPGHRPGDHGDHLHRLRRAGPRRAGAPTASSSSTSRSPAGSSTTPPRSGRSPARSRSAALADAAVQGSDLKGIGITNQRETVVAWDPRTGEPVHRALVWQDRRTAARCDELREAGHEAADPGAHRAGDRPLLLRHQDRVADRRTPSCPTGAVFGTIDSWLVFKLTGPPPDRLLERLADDAVRHPQARLGRGALRAARRRSRRRCRSRCPRRRSTARPRCSAARSRSPASPGDQQAALFGQACQRPGEAKNTYGTGSFVLLNTGTEAPEPGEGLLTTVAWGLGGEVDYALEAAVFVTGAAVQWLRDGLGIITDAAETEALAASLDSNDDVYFVPALTGLGSPHWDPYARGTIVGLTRGSGRAHLARAALEAIAYQTVDAVRAQEAASGESVSGAEGRRGRGRQRLADAVPGRRARRAGDRPRGGRDDRARRRLPGRDRHRPVDARSRCARCGARRRATSRAMAEDEREELLGRWREAARARAGLGRRVDPDA